MTSAALLFMLLGAAAPGGAADDPIPDIDKLVKAAGDALLAAQEDPSVPDERLEKLRERLGALYILSGNRAAGMRLLHPGSFAPPLPDETAPAPPLPSTGATDLPSIAQKLLARKSDPLVRAAGISLLLLSGNVEQAEAALARPPGKHPFLFRWLKVLLLLQTGRSQSAARAARAFADTLEGKSPFVIKNLSCIAPDAPVAFGVYKPLENPSYRPGELMALYYELEGFRAEKTSSGYSVRFKVDFGIFDADGVEVWHKPRPDTAAHTTRSEMRDVFLTSAFYVPSVLKPGTFALRLKVKDLVGGAEAVGEVTFRVRESR